MRISKKLAKMRRLEKLNEKIDRRLVELSGRQLQVFVLVNPETKTNKGWLAEISQPLWVFCPNPDCGDKMALRLAVLKSGKLRLYWICPSCKQWASLSVLLRGARIESHVRKTRGKPNPYNEESWMGKQWKRILDRNFKEIVREEKERMEGKQKNARLDKYNEEE